MLSLQGRSQAILISQQQRWIYQVPELRNQTQVGKRLKRHSLTAALAGIERYDVRPFRHNGYVRIGVGSDAIGNGLRG